MGEQTDEAGFNMINSLQATTSASIASRVADLEAQLKSCRTQAMQIESLRKIGSWVVNVEIDHLEWSEGTYKIFGLSSDVPITLEKALSFYSPEARAAIVEQLEAAIANGTSYDLTIPFTDAQGRIGWVRTLGKAEFQDGNRRIIGIIEDVSLEKTAQDRLRHLAYCDPVTKLPNRRAFQARLVELTERREGLHGVALFLIDIDRFKSVNDTYGHVAGDHLLNEVADRLQRCVRPTDMVARLGGDEFGIIFVDAFDPALISSRASTLLKEVRRNIDHEGKSIRATASIGISPLAGPAISSDEMFVYADVALYHAKSLGRDQAQIYESAFHKAILDERMTLEAVRQGIDKDEFVTFYQPIVDLRSGEVRGLEALVRWNHPIRGLLTPAAFEAALTDPELSVAIDDLVMRQSLGQMREWVESGIQVAAINVNASEAQLRRPDLIEHVMQLLAINRLTPERLKIEVVETAFLGRDPLHVAKTIDRLAELGVVCALDDFGTGYASLTHLKQFRVERIKIDRTFIANICSDPFDRGLTKSLIDLGRNLGIRITAEGVETAEQLALLQEFGCDCAQGYFIGRPTSAADVPNMLKRWYEHQAQALVD